MTRAQPEYRLHCYVADRLRRLLDPAVCFWTSIEHGGWRTPETAERMRRIEARAGLLDILFIVPGGRAFWIELKAEGEGLSDPQEAVAGWLSTIGAPVYLARTFDDVLAALRNEGVPVKAMTEASNV